MSGFRKYCTLAKSSGIPTGIRYKSIRFAVERYTWLTGTSFESVFAQLSRLHGFRVGATNDDATLMATAATLERARRAFVERLIVFANTRRIEKRAGRRYPTRVQLRTLRQGIDLGLQRSAIPAEAEPKADFSLPPGAPTPEYVVGDMVAVVVGKRHNTPRTGSIRRLVWHWKLHRWLYFLEENGRTVHTRYFDEDLARPTGPG